MKRLIISFAIFSILILGGCEFDLVSSPEIQKIARDCYSARKEKQECISYRPEIISDSYENGIYKLKIKFEELHCENKNYESPCFIVHVNGSSKECIAFTN